VGFVDTSVRGSSRRIVRRHAASRARGPVSSSSSPADPLSYCDAAILEAARLMGCSEVLSEDLSDGQDYAGIRVGNPFS
jgi:predicted nucleic acid-binding protein